MLSEVDCEGDSAFRLSANLCSGLVVACRDHFLEAIALL